MKKIKGICSNPDCLMPIEKNDVYCAYCGTKLPKNGNDSPIITKAELQVAATMIGLIAIIIIGVLGVFFVIVNYGDEKEDLTELVIVLDINFYGVGGNYPQAVIHSNSSQAEILEVSPKTHLCLFSVEKGDYLLYYWDWSYRDYEPVKIELVM